MLALVVLILIVIRFSPQTVLYLANIYSPVKIFAERVDVEFLPLTFDFKNIRLSEGEDQQFAELQSLRLSADWIGAVKGRHNFWDAELSGGVIDLRKLPDQNSDLEPQVNMEATTKIDFHRLVSTLSARVNNVKLLINDDSYLDLQKIESRSSSNTNSELSINSSDLKQSISMQFVYALDEAPLVINGTLESQQSKGFTDIDLQMANIDLSPLSQSLVPQSKVTSSEDESNTDEAEMDWAWLELLEATRITLAVGHLNYPDLDARNVNSDISFGDEIDFMLSSDLNLELAESLRFQDSIKLAGKLRPLAKKTISEDLSGEVHLETPRITIDLQGEFDVNGQFNNNLEVAISASKLPIETIPATTEVDPISALFPFTARFNVQNDSPDVVVSNIDLKLGDSDIRGAVSLTMADDSPLKLTARLNSDKVVIDAASQSDQIDEQDSEVSTDQAASEKPEQSGLFSDQAIDWTWLDDKDLDLFISIKELIFKEHQLLEVQFPLILNDSHLRVAPLQSQFAGGTWSSSLSMRKLDEGVVLALGSDLKEASLEAMNLIPKEQITQGDTNFGIQFESQGASPQELIAALNGKLLLDIREGQIENDYFEIIGSDLFSELLSKLNPFSKSDPTTELKCMVANLRFDKGEIQVDKSIAVETSKISVVADGEIDLGDEEIKLKIVPRTENGIGLGIGTLVKSVSLGGSLSEPVPHVTAGDLLKSTLAIGAALSTGGTSLLADGVLNKAVGASACTRAEKAFTDEAAKLDAAEQQRILEQERLIEQERLRQIEQQKLLDTSTDAVLPAQ